MEPITIAGAVYSQFQTSTLIGSLIGGILGNRADALLCKSTDVIYERIKAGLGEPQNHDVQKAVRKSYLLATLMAVQYTQSKYTFWGNLSGNANPSDIKTIAEYIKKELKLLESKTVGFPKTDSDEEYSMLLSPKMPLTEIQSQIKFLKESVLLELKRNKCRVETTLENAIQDGWIEERKNMDWYELTCAFFSEELKTNSRLSTFIQTEYLNEINNVLEEVYLSIEGLKNNLEAHHQKYISEIHKVQEGISRIENILEILPENIRQIIREEISNRSITHIPDITVSDKYIDLTHRVNELKKSEQNKKNEIENLKPLNKKDEILNCEVELININGQRQNAENELQTFISSVLKLAEHFQNSKSLNPMYEKASQLFYKGKFEEADKVLNEPEIYDAIETHKKRAEELSKLLILKAYVTIINKPDDWFNLTDKYLTKALTIDENYTNCNVYAIFLAAHNQTLNSAIIWHKKSLIYANYKDEKANTLNNLGNLQTYIKDYINAEISYKEALEIYRQLAEDNPQTYLSDVAKVLNGLASMETDIRKLENAEISYKEALEIYRQLAEDNPQTHLSNVAKILNNLATLERITRKYENAEISYKEALEISKRLAEDNPQTYLPGVAGVLNNLASLQKNISMYENAEISYKEALEIYRQLAEENPQTHLSNVASVLSNFGLLQQKNQDYINAEISYKEALEISKRLAENNPQTYLPDVAGVLNNLANLYRNIDFKNAEISYREALEIYRQLAEEYPQTYLSKVAGVLFNLGFLQVVVEDYKNAEISYREALVIFRQLAEDYPKIYLFSVAKILMHLGLLQEKMKEYENAEISNNEAMEIIGQIIDEDMMNLFIPPF